LVVVVVDPAEAHSPGGAPDDDVFDSRRRALPAAPPRVDAGFFAPVSGRRDTRGSATFDDVRAPGRRTQEALGRPWKPKAYNLTNIRLV